MISTVNCTKTKPTIEPVGSSKANINKADEVQEKSAELAPKEKINSLPQAPTTPVTEASTSVPNANLSSTANTTQPTPLATTNPAEVKPPVADPSKPQLPVLDDCDITAKFNEGEPVFLPENKVMITRVMSPCMTKEGLFGHRKNAGWMAMGFPCTGGEGRIDWKGTNYNRPKMVTFLLETSCAMAPSDTSKIKTEAQKVLNIAPTAPMIAFNPFVIQYWEIPGFDDADTSFTVDIRSGRGLDDAWIRFIKPKPLRILLVGRENAWVPGNFMYAVEGDLNWMNKNRFTFKVEKARILKDEELKAMRSRCESLKPERECSRVF